MSAPTGPRPESGLDIAEFDPDIRVQDDLFRHVNGRWIARTEIPADRARYGSFYLLAEKAEEAVRDIIIEAQGAAEGTQERKIGDLYSSFLDEERVEALGAEPLADDLARARAVSSAEELVQTIGSMQRSGSVSLIQLFVDNDPGNPERYLIFLEQGGLGLPDESYYREDKFAEIRAAYLRHLERVLALAGWDEPAVAAERVLRLETAIAAVHWDNVRTRDSEATYNLMTWEEVASLAAAAEGGGLDTWLRGLDVPKEALAEVVVREPGFLEGLAPLLTSSRLDEWRDWLAWQIIRSSSPYLSDAFVSASFDFYGRTLTGTPEIRARWKRGVSLVEGALGEAVGRTYVERHFPPAAKTEMDVLVASLIEAYRQSISQLEWMSQETRLRALDKLDKFVPKIGYPDTWRDYSALVIDPADLIGNVRRAGDFEFARELAKIGAPLDRGEWFMTPQTVNAYYNPGFNEIVFPAAILQFPFFVEGRDPAANYGAIGAVIGHEIGHGFDDQGSRFDGDGRLTDWWTPEDRAAFEERTASLIGQYDALEPLQTPGHHVNGALTIGENIGDLGGLGIAWKAYLLSLDGEEPPVIDGLTGAQRFFLSWAQAWQQKSRDEEVLRLLAIDPHSPSEFRANQIVRNLDPFYEAFGVTESDALWLPEDSRVTIW
ncbi:M13 family metallopeptidase [Amnibacterium flavum]|uniref:Peptidase M13 n=1 Tax=Amnibacterium flavum TaxID=2173173 RepID=A0A2V1HUN6_9MICO|nr:M13-type metalloendopeptidase [Amnibacterium flavum]PVZ96325.1 peptidase M13 [Amnibacterium flavum]